jgi:hypothetical protein
LAAIGLGALHCTSATIVDPRHGAGHDESVAMG